jgi:hypothetical protein
MVRHDGGMTILVGRGTFEGIESQVGLSILCIKAVAREAFIGQNRPNVCIKLQRFGHFAG